MTMSHSAAIHVVVGDEPIWKREAARQLVANANHCAQLQAVLSAAIDPLGPVETATALVERWREQRFRRAGSGGDAGRP